MKAFMDSIFRVAFEFELDNICSSNDEGKKFINAFDDANALTLLRFVDILWKINKFLNIRPDAKLRDNKRTIDEFVYKLIHIKTEQMSKPKGDLSVG